MYIENALGLVDYACVVIQGKYFSEFIFKNIIKYLCIGLKS